MGTAEFAVPCLRKLRDSHHDITLVATTPDKPAGRALRLTPSPVKLAADAFGLDIIQPDDLKDPAFRKAIQDAQPDLIAVVAFRILPPAVFTIPQKGTVNLHASLLPKYRGAAPIQWALINGERETGVTTFFIEKSVDTGNILLQDSVRIDRDDDAGTLTEKLSRIGADLLLRTIDGIEAGSLKAMPQSGASTPAPKISRETGLIDWNQSAESLHYLIRGMSPDPAAYSTLDGKALRLFKSIVRPEVWGIPGSVIETGDGRFVVACGNGGLEILEVQLEGKRRIVATEFLRGRRFAPGTSLGG